MKSLNAASKHAVLSKSIWKCATSTITSTRGLHESSLPAGRGGRSSFSGISATVFGGTGILGRSVTNHLCRIGSGITLPHRGWEENIRPIQLMGDLGQIQFIDFSIKQTDDEIRRLIEYSNCVVNVIGHWRELNHYSMEEVNYEWPTRLARLVAEKNDGTRLIHIGYLNSHQEYGRKVSKLLDQHHRTEIEMRNIYPETTLVRCANMFGFQSLYTNIFVHKRFKHHLALYGSVPLLYDAGRSTIIRPCYVVDVGAAVAKIAKHLDAPGKTFELMGPDAFTLHDFVERLCDLSGVVECMVNTLGPMDRSKANIIQKILQNRLDRYFDKMVEPRMWLPRALDMISNETGSKYQWISKDYFNLVHISDVGTGCLGFEDLGIKPTAWDDVAYRLFSKRNVIGMQLVQAKEKKERPRTRTVDPQLTPQMMSEEVALKPL